MAVSTDTPRAGGQSEIPLRTVLMQMPAIGWTTDCQLNVTSCFGGDSDRVVVEPGADAERPPSTYLEIDGSHVAPRAAHRCAIEGERTICEYDWSGEKFQANVGPLKDDDGRIIGCVGVAQSIAGRDETVDREEIPRQTSEHREDIHQMLQKQSQLTNTVLQNLPVMAFLLDEDGNFLESIGAGLRRLGRDDHQLNGENAIEVFPQIRKWIERALAGESVHFESEGTIEGKLWAFNNLLTFDEVRGSGAVGFAIDITEHKQAEQRLEKQRADLAHMARVRTVEELASGIAHELNQPLSVIAAQAEVTARKMRLGKASSLEERLSALDNIASEAHRAGQIIHRLRDFVRKGEPHRTGVNIADVVREATDLIDNDLRHAGITIESSLGPSIPRVFVDRVQVQQVLLNLLLNAMEAIEQAETDARGIEIQVNVHRGMLETTVRDTGCGISDERASRYFDNFFTTKADGMGMGLAISRSIVEAHGGRIWARRNPDRGATFTFTLPIPDED